MVQRGGVARAARAPRRALRAGRRRRPAPAARPRRPSPRSPVSEPERVLDSRRERWVDGVVTRRSLRPRARPARRTLGRAHRQPSRTMRRASRGARRGPARRGPRARGPRSARAARPCSSTSSGSSSRRMRFETVGFDWPTRSATSPSDRPNSSIRTAYARASSIGERSSRATFSTSPSRSVSRSSASRTTAGTVAIPASRGRAPAALAGDQLVAALEPRPHDDGLDQPLRLDRLGEAASRRRRRTACAAASDSGGSGRRRRARARARRRRSGPRSPRPRPRLGTLDKLHRHLPVGLGAASSAGRSGSRAGRGSAPRRRAPSAARPRSKTSSPKCLRTSASTSAESRVRPSVIVSSTPAISSCGLSRALIRLIDCTSCAQALERVVLGLHRHDHAVGRPRARSRSAGRATAGSRAGRSRSLRRAASASAR